MLLKSRETFSDAWSFNTHTLEWKFIKTIGEIEPKRNHEACIVGNFMVIIGGINHEDQVLDNINALNLESGKW